MWDAYIKLSRGCILASLLGKRNSSWNKFGDNIQRRGKKEGKKEVCRLH